MILQLCHSLKVMIIDTVKIQIKGIEIKEKNLFRFNRKTNTKNRPKIWYFNPDKEKERYLPMIETKEFEGIDNSFM